MEMTPSLRPYLIVNTGLFSVKVPSRVGGLEQKIS
jgi:hypothetical protein